MHHRLDPSPELLALADLQGGLVTREQATAHGLGRRSQQRLVQQGTWQSLAPSVLATRPNVTEFPSRAWLGILAAGDGGRIAEHAAGHHLGIVPEPPEEIVVQVPQSCGRFAPPGIRFVRSRACRPSRGTLPCTNPEQTVVDLCAADPEHMTEWVTTALRRRLTTAQRLQREVDLRTRLPAAPPVRSRLTALLNDAEGLESVLEKLFVDRVLRPHGLPLGERQYRRGSARHDLRIGSVLIELDGRLGHSATGDAFRDLRRDNAAAADGFITLRYGYADCWDRPCEAASQLHTVLNRLDPGVPGHPCPSCARP